MNYECKKKVIAFSQFHVLKQIIKRRITFLQNSKSLIFLNLNYQQIIFIILIIFLIFMMTILRNFLGYTTSFDPHPVFSHPTLFLNTFLFHKIRTWDILGYRKKKEEVSCSSSSSSLSPKHTPKNFIFQYACLQVKQTIK